VTVTAHIEAGPCRLRLLNFISMLAHCLATVETSVFFRLNLFLAPALIDRLLHRGAYVDSKTVPTTTRFTADLNPQKETQLHYTGAVL